MHSFNSYTMSQSHENMTPTRIPKNQYNDIKMSNGSINGFEMPPKGMPYVSLKCLDYIQVSPMLYRVPYTHSFHGIPTYLFEYMMTTSYFQIWGIYRYSHGQRFISA